MSQKMQDKPFRSNSSILIGRDRQMLRRRLLESPCRDIIDIENTITLRTGQAFYDLTKLALYLISNNIAHDTGIGPLIVSECKTATNGMALQRLFEEANETITAFADVQLHYAIQEDDAELVRALLRSGISPDSHCGVCCKTISWDAPRLECAISASAENAATVLLDAGADPNKDVNGTNRAYLRKCYERNLFTLAEELLKRGVGKKAIWNLKQEPWDIQDLDIVSAAAVHGGLPAIQTLTKYQPMDVERAIQANRSTPFIIAASFGNETLIQFWLTRYNVSPKSCDVGLCGAAANGQNRMVELLISKGSNIDGDHGSILYNEKGFWTTIFCDVTALEAAVGSNQLSTAKLLIGHGGNTKIKTLVLNKILWPMFDNYGQLDIPGIRTLQQKFNYSHVVDPNKFGIGFEGFLLQERMETFRYYRNCGAEPNGVTLVWLAFAGALDSLTHLIKRGLSLDSLAVTCFDIFPYKNRQESYVSPLAAALYSGNDKVAEYLLQNGANVNMPAGTGGNMSPLAASVIQGRLEWTNALINRGANPRDPIALWAAACTGSTKAYKIISTASMEKCGDSIADYAGPAASEAIMHGKWEFLREIAAQGIHINKFVSPWRIESRFNPSNPPDDHPLNVAVRNLDIRAVQLLLDKGANPNFGDNFEPEWIDDREFSPKSYPLLSNLPFGSSRKLLPVASALIKAGANINYSGRTVNGSPMEATIWWQMPMALTDLLIREGADLDALSISERAITTPLCQAVWLGRYQTVNLLLAKGAQVSSLPRVSGDRIPLSAVQAAAKQGHLDILELLLGAVKGENQFLSEYPLALRLAQRGGHRAVAHHLQAHCARMFKQLSCDSDEAILKNLEDKGGDRK